MNNAKSSAELRNHWSVPQPLYFRFGNACLDPRATIAAVHDFESFTRFWKSIRNRPRTDRMQKLYNLYLTVSKCESALSNEQLNFLKTITPGYEKVSMTFFLDDLYELASSGIIIVKTPTLAFLKQQEEYNAAIKCLQEKVIQDL